MTRVVGVVGPSGVGKDSVMAGLARTGDFRMMTRVITRPAQDDAEQHIPATPAEFQAQIDAGTFVLWWEAHGLHYGIPKSEITDGTPLMVNLSRQVLHRASRVFDDFTVLSLTSRPETLLQRLTDRGREPLADITNRLAREVAMPDRLTVVTIANDGPLAHTVTAVHRALTRNKEPQT